MDFELFEEVHSKIVVAVLSFLHRGKPGQVSIGGARNLPAVIGLAAEDHVYHAVAQCIELLKARNRLRSSSILFIIIEQREYPLVSGLDLLILHLILNKNQAPKVRNKSNEVTIIKKNL